MYNIDKKRVKIIKFTYPILISIANELMNDTICIAGFKYVAYVCVIC